MIPFFINCAKHCSVTVGCSAFSFNRTSHYCQPFLFDPTLAEEKEEDEAKQPEFLVKHENGKMMRQIRYF